MGQTLKQNLICGYSTETVLLKNGQLQKDPTERKTSSCSSISRQVFFTICTSSSGLVAIITIHIPSSIIMTIDNFVVSSNTWDWIILSVEKQKGLTASHLYTQLGAFASNGSCTQTHF